MIANHKVKRVAILYSILFLGIILLLLFFGVTYYLTHVEKTLTDRMYPNVFIDNKPVGGKTKNEVSKLYKDRNKALQPVNIYVLYNNQPIATFSAQTLNIHSNGEEIVDRAYQIGRTPNGSTRLYQKLATIFRLTRYDFTTQVVYDKGTVRDFVTDTEQQYNKPAKNALFTFDNGHVSTFRPDEKGLKMNSDQFYEDIDKAIGDLNTKVASKSVIYKDIAINPEITLAQANNFGIEELIGQGQSDYSHSIPSRVHNLTLAASKFHGVLIPKDGIISFNDIVGDISSLTGYEPAYIIQNGRTVLGDGGGVCQVSTTLFRAALNTGLPILERTAHAYRVGYYENDAQPGLDATTFSPTVDLKIKNDTPGSILIQVEQDKDNNLLTFKLYGKNDGRKAELSPIVLSNAQPAPEPVYQDDPTMKKGEIKQVDFAASGIKSVFTYKVTRNNQVTFEKTFVSNYRPWAAVYLRGTAD